MIDIGATKSAVDIPLEQLVFVTDFHTENNFVAVKLEDPAAVRQIVNRTLGFIHDIDRNSRQSWYAECVYDKAIVSYRQAPRVTHRVRETRIVSLLVAAGPDLAHCHVFFVNLKFGTTAETFHERQRFFKRHRSSPAAIVEQDDGSRRSNARVVLIGRPRDVADRC